MSPSPSPTPTFVAVRPFSVHRAMRHVRVLAGRIGPRTAGSGAYRRAVTYVERELRSLGYLVRVDAVPLPQGGRTFNVVATEAGSASKPLIVGAHLDTVPGSPGANDNASGVAVLLEVARAIAGTRFAPEIAFVAFGGEEIQPGGTHHVGSEAFVADLSSRERERVRGMVSVDMIGKAAPLTVGWLGQGSPATVGVAVRSARRAGVEAVPKILPDASDHGPFERAGIPAALLWTGLEENYHSPGDVVSNVDPPALANAGEVVLGIVRRLVG